MFKKIALDSDLGEKFHQFSGKLKLVMKNEYNDYFTVVLLDKKYTLMIWREPFGEWFPENTIPADIMEELVKLPTDCLTCSD
jgi:hypothetical protein